MKNKKWNKNISIIILFVMLLLIPAFSFAEEVGLFTKVAGRVDILKAGVGSVVPVKSNDTVYIGDIIRTKSDGKAEITFKDQTIIVLAPGSRIEINTYMYNSNNIRNMGVLNLFRGKVRAIVSKTMLDIIPAATGKSTFNINTPTAITGVMGTEFIVSYDLGITRVIFKDGVGFTYNPNVPQIVNINAGLETFIMNYNVQPSLPKSVAKVELMQYIKDTTIDEKTKEEKRDKDKKIENITPSAIVRLATLMAHEQTNDMFGFTPPQDTHPDMSFNKTNEPMTLLPVTETNPQQILKNTETKKVKVNVEF